MVDPGTILAIVSLIGGVVGSVDKVITLFDSVQNAPEEVREFRVSVARLQRQFTALQAATGAAGSSFLHEDDVTSIEDTLRGCRDLFTEHDTAFSNRGGFSGVFKATWTVQSSNNLKRYKAKLDTQFQQIILPIWLATLASQSAVASTSEQVGASTSERACNPAEMEQQSLQSVNESNNTVSAVPKDYLELLNKGVANLKAIDHQNRDAIEKALRTLDQTLQKCWTELGLPVQEIYDNAGLTDRRRGSQTFKLAPTTMLLENDKVLEQHKILKLERVHIMAREEQSRILQYQSRDTSINITHIIPYGSIPWTREPNSRTVSFLRPHVVTVVDSEGYHLYHISPKYRFKDPKHCREFQSTLRERLLLDAFMGIEIEEAGVVTAKRQVIRLWKRESTDKSDKRPVITMTYLETSRGDGLSHTELDMGRFTTDPQFVTARNVLGRRPAESKTIEIFSVSPQMCLRIRFQDIEDARKFILKYKAIHPLNPLAPQVELIYASSASGSTSATPAATPSDSLWSTSQPPSDSSVFSLDAFPDDSWKDVFKPMDPQKEE